MATLGIGLAGMLAFANRKLFVFEDPRIEEVENRLPKSNCGACGQPGCRAFAEKVVAGNLMPAQCTVSSPEQRNGIADFLGVAAGDVEKKVARLACAGGRHVAFLRARYAGHDSCRAAAVVSGGGKECAWGCLGLADCANVCTFDAIHMDLHGLPVVDADKCTACGKCVADAPPGLMKLNGNLAAINYELNAWATRVPIERCPTGAIVWFDNPNHAVKGAVAKKVLRNEPLPVLH